MKFIFLAIFFVSWNLKAEQPTLPPLPLDYQERLATEKLDILWNQKIIPSEYSIAPELESMGLLDMLSLLSKSFLTKSFDHVSDEMPKGRLKLLHPYGSVVQVEFVPSINSQESGLLKSGAIGIARLSLAGNPHLLGYTPGMGLKFLVDKKPSINLHVMNSLSGQGNNQNFFALAFSNIIPKPPLALVLLAKAFSRVKNPPTELNVNGLTRINGDGSAVHSKDQKQIYQLVFTPNPQLTINPNTPNDFRYELSQIPINSALYTVYAKRTKDSQLKRIGTLITRSEFIASQYGDENLFFQHQR